MNIEEIIQTPIQKINNLENNNFFMKRDDLIPFSFGGNKVRIALEFIKDLENKNCNLMIAYGNSRSNLCRVISNMCYIKKIECWIISPIEDDEEYIETNNSILVKSIVQKIITCRKNEVPDVIQKTLNEAINLGKKPYYIYDSENEKCTRNAYKKCYQEILNFEKETDIFFKYIFFASGTGTTQSGLICGMIDNKEKNRKIIGISNARNRERGKSIIDKNIEKYIIDNNLKDQEYFHNYDFIDEYVLEGYGKYNSDVVECVRNMYYENGIPMDVTYTGKAFWGMNKYLKKNNISNENILFIHTGGTPLFFDNIQLFEKRK